MAREDGEKQLAEMRAQLASQQEQVAALLSIVAKLGGVNTANQNKPRSEPKGLQEVRFLDERGNSRKAWLESRRTIKLMEGNNEKNRVVHEVEVADLCVELRPGKFHSIQDVPGLDVKRASHLLTQVRWYTLEQEKGLNQYQKMLKETASTPAPVATASAGDDDLGLKGA